MARRAFDVDVAIIGSGFGGSVAALRLAEKGYRVLVLEAGRRFSDEEFARTSWDLRNFLWAPHIGLTGIQRIHLLKDVVVLAGAGVGGGSLVYANTLYVPGSRFFEDPQWSAITDWARELAPYYDQAARMLGVVDNPTMTPSDLVMKAVADEMGVGHTFRLTPVGVYFGDGPGIERPDPFFGGAGPARTGCTQCGECMTGCRWNAKNTLPKNYLALAERAGARILPMMTVNGVHALSDGGFRVDAVGTGRWLPQTRSLTARHVVMAAGTYGTQRLLHRMRAEGGLPGLSARLGHLSRTNSEAILGGIGASAAEDFTSGVAITSSFFPDEHTHVEPVRYGKGSNAMGLLQSILTTPEPGVPRWQTFVREVASQPNATLSLLDVRRWSERTVIALVMQTLDNALVVEGQRGRLGGWHLTSRNDADNAVPSYIPIAHDVVRRIAALVNGIPGTNVFENFDAALTAHFVGGCTIGEDAEHGVIDAYHRAFGHPDLHILDGSAITANLGVNPSLTITAQAERAMAMWPNNGEPDHRPVPGSDYRPVAAVAPRAPVVPASAPGALRLPVTPA